MDRRPGEGSGAGEEPDASPGLPGAATPGSAPGPSAEGAAAPGPGGVSDDRGPSADGAAAPGPGGATPGPGAPSGPGPGAPSGGPSGSGHAETRDPGLAGFVHGGVWDSAVPSAALAAALEGAAGAGWRCEGGSRAGIVGAVRAAAALESWWSAAKLGLIRAAIRQDDDGLGGYHGDLPDAWSRSLTADIALALAMSPVSAGNLMQTAWDLGALLPGIGALLEDGTLTYPKARAVNDALELLSEPDKEAAEAMIVPRLAGKTYGQVDKIAAQAAITVDPDLAEQAREHAERNRARVFLKRERSGAASLSGCELPPAETLAAHAATCARAQLYKDSGAFPGVLMDQFRAMAYLDLINEVSAEARIAAGPPDVGLGAPGESAFRDEPEPDDPGVPAPDGSGGSDCPCTECDGKCAPHDDAPDDDAAADDDEPDDGGAKDDGPDDEPDEDGAEDDGPDDEPDDDGPSDGGPDDEGPDNGGSADGGRDGDIPDESFNAGLGDRLGQNAAGTDDPGIGPPEQRRSSPWSAPPASPAPPKPIDLSIPLATLLGPPRRPGESHGFGPLDPALSCALAARAAASPHTTACVTVTDNGYAIGHGCLRDGRRRAQLPGSPDPPLAALPARLNLTISAARLTQLLEPPGRPRPPGPASPSGWALTPPATADLPGPPGDPPWCRTWTITLPGGLQYAVPLEPVPTYDCDHRRESKAYAPNDMLRHLVQVRDHECTLPTCSRHAKEADFEHAVPYDQGGRTCGCNAGARSRACHQIKQTPGWKVTQPKPGWHQWETPSGRVYTQEPKRYPT